ncbi:MAG TPA: hypothetical protein VK698_03355 [Kofleriaceae bacterium]|nr:hypothetical protein [Kofleriaceae bacterium]
MRRCLLASLLAALLPVLPGCASDVDGADPELVTAQSDEPTLFLVTVRPDHDYVGCLASADAIEGVDVLLELPLLFKFVTTSALRPGPVGRALFALRCVQTADFDTVTRPDELCNDFAESYCAKAAECLTPEELAIYGLADQCVANQAASVCQLLDFCKLVDLEAAPECVAEVGTGTCEQFRSSLNGIPPLAYPACQEVCVL